MIFRQLFDAPTSTYTYLVGDESTRQAVLIDPVFEQLDRDLALIDELGLDLTYTLDTHVHADHVTAAAAIRDRSAARSVASKRGAPCADVHVSHGDVLRIGDLSITALATPGHSDDSISFLAGDRVFTGDALLIRSCGRTDFQNGDAKALYSSLTRVLFALPDDTLVYPGHDYSGHTVSTIGEEKRWNRRIAGRGEPEFVALMSKLDLPAPRNIATAVPANHACGQLAGAGN